MQKYIEILKNNKLFEGISEKDIVSIINCLDMKTVIYNKGSTVYRIGDKVKCINIVAEGAVHIIKEDYWGNQSILTEISTGELFAETFALLKDKTIQVNVMAVKKSVIIELNIDNVINLCNNSCSFHKKIVQNLLFVLASKNYMLTNKVEAMAQRSIRNKVMTYLSQQKSSSFDIPFNRQQLADYLAVDRSALSKEIAKLKAEGIIDYHKNHFELK